MASVKRARKRGGPPPKQTHAQHENPQHKQLFLQILWTLGKVGAAFIALSTFVGGVFFFYDLFEKTIPEISLGENSASWAFEPPFIVRNNSDSLEMKNVTLRCRVADALVKNNPNDPNDNGIQLHSSITFLPIAAIAPHELANFRCAIGKQGDQLGDMLVFAPTAKVVSAHIFLSVTYDTLFWKRRVSPEEEFRWMPNLSPPRWIRGAFSG